MVGRSFKNAGWNVIGIDLTAGMAEEANRYFPAICAPAEKIPFLDEAFDVAVLRQAYFLIPDGQQVLAQISRVLRPDGTFVFGQTVPYSSKDAAWLEKIHRTKQAALLHFFTEEGAHGGMAIMHHGLDSEFGNLRTVLLYAPGLKPNCTPIR